jgi:hypothetical protein
VETTCRASEAELASAATALAAGFAATASPRPAGAAVDAAPGITFAVGFKSRGSEGVSSKSDPPRPGPKLPPKADRQTDRRSHTGAPGSDGAAPADAVPNAATSDGRNAEGAERDGGVGLAVQTSGVAALSRSAAISVLADAATRALKQSGAFESVTVNLSSPQVRSLSKSPRVMLHWLVFAPIA